MRNIIISSIQCVSLSVSFSCFSSHTTLLPIISDDAREFADHCSEMKMNKNNIVKRKNAKKNQAIKMNVKVGWWSRCAMPWFSERLLGSELASATLKLFCDNRPD